MPLDAKIAGDPQPGLKTALARALAASDPPFTPDEAQTLIRIARGAPMPHMDEAEARIRLLTRFAKWANEQFRIAQATPATPVEPPTPSAAEALANFKGATIDTPAAPPVPSGE